MSVADSAERRPISLIPWVSFLTGVVAQVALLNMDLNERMVTPSHTLAGFLTALAAAAEFSHRAEKNSH